MTTIWPELRSGPGRRRRAAAAAALGAAARAAAPEPVLPLPEPVPVTCWPTVRLTDATVPAMVDVSEASSRLVCAVESDDSAEVTEAWSESIWLVEAPEASSLARRSWAESSCACAAFELFGERGGVDGGEDLSRRHGLPGLDVDRGDRARDREVEIGLAGRLDGARAGDRLLDRARRHRDRHRGDREPAGVDEPEVSQRGSAIAAATRTTAHADDRPAVAAPERRLLGAKDVLVVERQLLGEVHRGLLVLTVSRIDHAGQLTADFTTSQHPAVSPLGVPPQIPTRAQFTAPSTAPCLTAGTQLALVGPASRGITLLGQLAAAPGGSRPLANPGPSGTARAEDKGTLTPNGHTATRHRAGKATHRGPRRSHSDRFSRCVSDCAHANKSSTMRATRSGVLIRPPSRASEVERRAPGTSLDVKAAIGAQKGRHVSGL